MRNGLIRGTIVLLAFCMLFTVINAQVLMNYQGRLTGLDGQPVVDDIYQITFSLWSDSTGGTRQWIEAHPSVQTSGGLFSVVLGGDSTLNESVFETEPLFMQIMLGYGDIISPRTRLTSVPSAAYAKKVVGDIETGDGYLNLKSSDSNLAVSIITEGRGGPAFVRMYNPNVGFAEQTLVQLSSESDGGNLDFYRPGDGPNNPAFTIGIEPSPFYPAHLSFYDPDGSLPFDPYVKMGVEPSPFRGYLEMSDPGSGFADRALIRMGVEPSPFHKGYFAMYNPELGTPPKLMEMEINDESGDWESFFNMYFVHPPEYPTEKKILALNSAPSSGASIKMFNPQPEPPAELLEIKAEQLFGPSAEWGSEINMYLVHPPEYPTPKEILSIGSAPSTGASFKMFDPQPEPPVEVFNVSFDMLGRAGEVSMELTESGGTTQTKLTPGRVKIGDDVDDTKPRGEFFVNGDTAIFYIQGFSDPTPAPMIAMMSSSGEAKMGIGTSTINENLVVGDDLGGYSGTRLVVGGSNAGTNTGFVFGENSSYRGWMLWDVDNDLVELGTKEGLGNYGSTIVLKSGTVGIGGQSSGADLHVNGDICYTGTIGSCSDRRYKTDIHRLDHALDKISRLRGVSFNWKIDQYPDYKFSEKEQVGLIAQEVKDVLPQVVSEDNNGYYNIDYSKITPLLVEAVKELKAENERQADLIEKLQQEINELK